MVIVMETRSNKISRSEIWLGTVHILVHTTGDLDGDFDGDLEGEFDGDWVEQKEQGWDVITNDK